MSAPPIGMMISAPNTNDASASNQNAARASLPANQTTTTMIASARPRLIACRAGKMIGAPLMRPESLRNAMTDPVKVTAPIAVPSDISTRLAPWMWPMVPMPNAFGAYSAPAATSTAAMPTSEWNAATSSGIAVIGTRRAITDPMPPPQAMPSTTNTQDPNPAGGWEARVVSTAMTMPAMPNILPRWLDSGLDSP